MIPTDLKILDLQKDFDIAISDAFASSGEDSLLKRQEIERSGTIYASSGVGS
jgi:hypothetical protein